MDAGSKLRYGVSATDVKGGVIVLVEASPAYLAQRMKLVESMLAGDNRVVLTASPSEEAERLKACRHVSEVRLWNQPYETVLQRSILGPGADQLFQASMAPFNMSSLVDSRTIRTFTEEPEVPLFYADRSKDLLNKPDTVTKTRRRERSSAQRSEDAPHAPLSKARIKHLKGELTGESNAIALYQLARPSEADLDAAKFLSPQDKTMYRTGKQDAAYWLALLAFEQRKYDSARDSLVKRVLEAIPGSAWIGVRQVQSRPRGRSRGQVGRSHPPVPRRMPTSPTARATCSAAFGWRRSPAFTWRNRRRFRPNRERCCPLCPRCRHCPGWIMFLPNNPSIPGRKLHRRRFHRKRPRRSLRRRKPTSIQSPPLLCLLRPRRTRDRCAFPCCRYGSRSGCSTCPHAVLSAILECGGLPPLWPRRTGRAPICGFRQARARAAANCRHSRGTRKAISLLPCGEWQVAEDRRWR